MIAKKNNKIAHDEKSRMDALLSTVLLVFVLIFYPLNESAASAPIAVNELVLALLDENWENVADNLLSSVDAQTESPILRMIKAHAALALNRNNESMCLFVSVKDDKSLKSFDEWTQHLVKKYPQNTIALYFRGDALARLSEWELAVVAFSKALEAQNIRNQAMVLNARGLVFAAKGQFDNAIVDFTNATQVWPHLADAYANLGFLSFLEMEGAKGALEDFNRAINVSPDFSLARYGKGSMYMILGELIKAETEFDTSITKSGCLGPRLLDKIRISLKRLRNKKAILIASAEKDNPGFSVDSSIKAMNKNDLGFRGSKYKRGLKDATIKGGKSLGDFQKATTSYLQKNPSHAKYIRRYNSQVKTDIATSAMAQKYDLSVTSGAGFKIGSESGKRSRGFDISSKRQDTISYDLRPSSKLAHRSLSRLNTYESGLVQSVPGYTSRPQGFDAGPSEGNIDDGLWPDVAEFGLLYNISSK